MRELDGTVASFREEKRVESVSRGTGREEKWRRERHLKYHGLMGMCKKWWIVEKGRAGREGINPVKGGGGVDGVGF